MTSLRKGPCSPRAQPPWKTTRVRNRQTLATCRIWQAAANSWSSGLISSALCSRPAFTGKGRGKWLWPAFLFLLTKPSAIGLPWPQARPACPLPACELPWRWWCAFCQWSSWRMGSRLPAKQIYWLQSADFSWTSEKGGGRICFPHSGNKEGEFSTPSTPLVPFFFFLIFKHNMSIRHPARCPSAKCIGLSGIFFWRQSINNLVFVFAVTHMPPPSASWVRMQCFFRDDSSQAAVAITIRQKSSAHGNQRVTTWWKM